MALIFGTNVSKGQGSLHAKNYLLSSSQYDATTFLSFPDFLEIQTAAELNWVELKW